MSQPLSPSEVRVARETLKRVKLEYNAWVTGNDAGSDRPFWKVMDDFAAKYYPEPCPVGATPVSTDSETLREIINKWYKSLYGTDGVVAAILDAGFHRDAAPALPQAEKTDIDREFITSVYRKIVNNREKYLGAWIAETGLKPSECEIVEDLSDPLRTVLSVRKRPAAPVSPEPLVPEPDEWPCHKLSREQWCDRHGPGGFMGHTCKTKLRLPLERNGLFDSITSELDHAYAKHGRAPWSRHEFYAILLEEVDELWNEIKHDGAAEAVKKEALQVASMVIRYLETLSPPTTENG